MFFTKMCHSGGTKHIALELLLGILRAPGQGRGGPHSTVPLQKPKVTSRKACLRTADETTPTQTCKQFSATFSNNSFVICFMFLQLMSLLVLVFEGGCFCFLATRSGVDWK